MNDLKRQPYPAIILLGSFFCIACSFLSLFDLIHVSRQILGAISFAALSGVFTTIAVLSRITK